MEADMTDRWRIRLEENESWDRTEIVGAHASIHWDTGRLWADGGG